uniref:Uncharacterized protein n=1 Tax=Oryzias latipes TaxID=8090 RepID=A0A3P9JFK0_ORYLA
MNISCTYHQRPTCHPCDTAFRHYVAVFVKQNVTAERLMHFCGTLHRLATVPPNTPSGNWSLGSAGSPDGALL